MISKDILVKFGNGPGVMSKDELLELREYFVQLSAFMDVYKAGTGINHFGQTLNVNLISIDWYIDRINNRQK